MGPFPWPHNVSVLNSTSSKYIYSFNSKNPEKKYPAIHELRGSSRLRRKQADKNPAFDTIVASGVKFGNCRTGEGHG